jgi:hypothetical protein
MFEGKMLRQEAHLAVQCNVKAAICLVVQHLSVLPLEGEKNE